MNKRLIGILACISLLVISVLISAFYNDQPYTHQYDKEDSISNYKFAEVDDVYTNFREINDDNYCLDDYFFSNLAGDVMDISPTVKYMRVDNQLCIVQENYFDSIGRYEYILKIDPLETAEGRDLPDRIVSFIDYSYLSKQGRYVYAIDQGNYSLDDIKSELSYFEKCLYSYEYEDDDYGHQAQLNERSFVDYFILYELAYPGYYSEENFVVYKDQHNRYRIFNGSFVNSSDKTYADEIEYHNLISTSWFSMLSKSQIFTDAVIEEYEYLRKNSLSDKNINKVLDECTNFLLNSDGINKDEVSLEKEQLTTYINERIAWLDKNIYGISGFSAHSAVKEYNNTPY